MNIAIIGAGYAGLSAAYDLAKAGGYFKDYDLNHKPWNTQINYNLSDVDDSEFRDFHNEIIREFRLKKKLRS